MKDEVQTVLGWREVPIDESLIGEEAKRIRPHFLQVFIGRNPDLAESMDFERKLYIIRRRAEKKIIPLSEGMGTDFYIASLSSKPLCTRACLPATRCAISIWTCRIWISRPPWPWFIPASAPIPSPAGQGPSEPLHCA